MKLGLKYYIKDMEARIKRLEEKITLKLAVVANVIDFNEKCGVTDTYEIYSRTPNNTFYVGYSLLGTDKIGDLRGSPVLLYSGS